jgi:hypothetical protein
VTKDNLLFAGFGLVLGFVAAWLMFEKVTMNQPARAVPGQAGLGNPAAPPAGAADQGAPPPGGSGIPLDLSRLEALQQQVQQNPENPDLLLALAQESHEIAQQVPNPAGSRPLWTQARDLYGRYVQLRPDDANLPVILSDLGVAHQELGEYDQALEIYRRVQGLAPDYWPSLYNQVVVLAFGKNELDEAAKILEELKRMQPNNPDVQRLAEAVEEQRKAA